MHKLLSLPVCLALLAGCTTTSYIAPEPVTTPILGQPMSVMTTERVVPVSFNQAWDNIAAYSQGRYRTIRRNKANGEMTLFVDAFDPSSSITCGMLQTQGGGYDTHNEFLSYLTTQTPVNLNVTVQVKLSPKTSTQTSVSVNTDYDLAVNYQTNPATGAIVGGSQYRFNSKGFAMVNAPGSDFAARCQSTGSVEAAILNAAGTN
ncbi:hypothetical protein [Orrella daihaiensis]|uniref:Lipoprotein n=1 Tax=Orrella daihaiensis TaxID=2782176 RepID=A0ABY4AL06_9BURK|nr:hypothetical protein [Orrella daihaiensis]UOD50957.1 hypothetical protein DHf2319_03295 [Orrella daihaiensis]